MNVGHFTRFLLTAAFACGLTTALEASTHYWVGKEGSRSWHDAKSWSPTSAPVSGEACIFEYANTTGPVEITYDGTNAATHYLAFYAKSGVTDNDGTFEKAVYLRGGGVTHTLDAGAGINVGYRRKLVIDDLTIRGGASGYHYLYGHVSLLNGADVKVGDSSYLVPGYAGSRVLIDNASYEASALSPATGGGKLIVRHNGYLCWGSSWAAAQKWATLDVDFITGKIIAGSTYQLYNHTFLPKRPGGVLIGRNTSGAAFWTSGDVTVRLGGEAWFTNSIYGVCVFTNSVALYGRGRVMAGSNVAWCESGTNSFDLAEVSVGYRVGNSTSKAKSVYFGDTLFTPVRETSDSFYFYDYAWFVGGTKTFDMQERFGGRDIKRWLSISQFFSNCRSKTVFRNLKTSTAASIYLRNNDDTYGALELGENCPVMLEQTSYYYLAPAFDGLKMGPGSSIKTAGSMYNYVKVYGETDIDPTAKFIRQSSAKAEGEVPYALLSTYDDDATEPTFEMTTASAGYSVHRVGGSFFYGDGKYKASSVYGAEWTGAGDGLWSNTNNWGNLKLPNDNTTYFTGFRNTVVTNDLDNVKAFKLLNGSGYSATPGPFIIRGKPIEVTATTEAVCAYGMYPFIIENDLTYAATGDFQVKGRGNNINPTPVVLRGTVSVADGSFSPDGQVVIQGTVNAKDLHFRNWTGSTVSGTGCDWRTKLRVENGGTVNIANQTTVNDAKATFFISKGGTVNITGDLKWATVTDNENCVRGALNVSGALGGDATQAFYGTGVVQVATLDGSEGASVRIGEGMTLVTTASGTTTMPVVMSQGDATLAPQADLTLAGGVRVDALGRTLTVSNDCAVSVTGALAGYDFDFVKKGAGRLQLADAPGLTNGYAKIEKGTLAITQPTTMGQLTASAGATLEFVADANGNVPTVSLGDNLDLSNFKIKVTGEPTMGVWQTLVKVGEDLTITGTPDLGSNVRLKVVRHADDTVSLCVRPRCGLTLIVR